MARFNLFLLILLVFHFSFFCDVNASYLADLEPKLSEKMMSELKLDIKEGRGVSLKNLKILLSSGEIAIKTNPLKYDVVARIATITDSDKRAEYSLFVASLMSELEFSIHSYSDIDHQLAQRMLALYKDAELEFVKLTEDNTINRSSRIASQNGSGSFRDVFYNKSGEVVRVDEYYGNGVLKRQSSYIRSSMGGMLVNIIEYYDNGKIHKTGSYLDSQKNGKFYKYDRQTGKLILEENYVVGIPVGRFKKYSDRGAYLLLETLYENGEKILDIRYRSKGVVEKITRYVDGFPAVEENYRKSGILSTKVDHIDGRFTKFDKKTGNIIMIVDMHEGSIEYNGELGVTEASIRGQMMLFLSYTTELTYDHISSLTNRELSEETILVISDLLANGTSSEKYNLAVANLILPGVLEFIKKNTTDASISDLVYFMERAIANYYEHKYTVENSRSSISGIRMSSFQKQRIAALYRIALRSVRSRG